MKSHRPVVMGTRGMVATGHPLASDAGLDVLKDGGNAFDAAVCASAVLSVVKSYHCGLGGDLFGVFYSSEQGRVLCLNGSGRSPSSIGRELFSDHIPHRGILAASIPGTVHSWIEIVRKLGSRDLKSLLSPAIEYAEKGFPVFPHLATVIRSTEKTLGSDPAWASIFLPEGKSPNLSDLFVQSDLAGTLAQIATEGRECFYSGDILRAILRSSEAHGGFFTAADFNEHQSRWEEPIFSDYRGSQIYVPPPNSYGLLLLLQLKYLTDYPLATLKDNPREYVCLQVKAKEKAWKVGERWIRDPDDSRRQEIFDLLNQYSEKSTEAHPAVASHMRGDTTYIAVADKSGNWASVIQSVHQSFGCGIVVEGTGIVLNNRMSGFNLIPGHPNEIGPAKRPAHTLSPVLVLKGNRPILALGTPGGLGQTQFLVQIFCNLFDFNMGLQEAVEAPRWQSETESRVELENRFSTDVSDFLRHEGYEVKVAGPWEFSHGGAEAISLHDNGKVLLGAADPRREGYAAGY